MARSAAGEVGIAAILRIPVEVVRPFRLKLSTHSIGSCPPIPVEVVRSFRSEVVHFFGLHRNSGQHPGTVDNIPESLPIDGFGSDAGNRW